jgi:SRSO17 transposase
MTDAALRVPETSGIDDWETCMTMIEDAAPLSDISEFMDQFRTCLGRRDRARWAKLYVHGLLAPEGAKNLEGLARRAALHVGRPESVISQSLQNLVSQSPWDDGQLWRRYRSLLFDRYAHPDGVLVIEDIVIPKQGRRSVGVQRQFSTALGRKINCQVAVAVYYVGSGVCFPLSLRLYLPSRLLRAESQQNVAGVPREFRDYRSRARIALELLEELSGEQPTSRYALLGHGYGADPELRRALTRQGRHVLALVPPDFVVLHQPGSDSVQPPRSVNGVQPITIERLAASTGLGRHKKPDDTPALLRIRTWPQFADVEEFDLLMTIPDGATMHHVVGKVADMDPARIYQLWHSRVKVEREQMRLKNELGLDHFEGRSWRGFHHHASLVALAHGFRLTREGFASERGADSYFI